MRQEGRERSRERVNSIGSNSTAQGPRLAPRPGLAQAQGPGLGLTQATREHGRNEVGEGKGEGDDEFRLKPSNDNPSLFIVGDEENQLDDVGTGGGGGGGGGGVHAPPDDPLSLPAPPTLPYSCVLVDYTMPEMSGPTCVQQLRDIGYTGVVIGVTGHATAEATESFLSHGANSGLKNHQSFIPPA